MLTDLFLYSANIFPATNLLFTLSPPSQLYISPSTREYSCLFRILNSPELDSLRYLHKRKRDIDIRKDGGTQIHNHAIRRETKRERLEWSETRERERERRNVWEEEKRLVSEARLLVLEGRVMTRRRISYSFHDYYYD